MSDSDRRGRRRFVMAGRISACILVLGAIMTPAASAQAPLGMPIPTSPTTDDLVVPAEGDGQSPLPGANACRSAPATEISLPADDAPHRNTYLEWWWWYGHVTTSRGDRLGYLVLWEYKPWADEQAIEYAITDFSDDSFHFGIDRVSGAPEVNDGVPSVKSAHTAIDGGDGTDRIRLNVKGYDLRLSLKTVKPPVVSGFRRIFCNEIYLYSRVRMPTRGTLVRGRRKTKLRGSSHFDHSWGFVPAYLAATTTMLSFELDDGRDIAVARAEVPGAASYVLGYVSDSSGRTTLLHRDDFTLTPTRYWERDASCRYPVAWDVEIQGEQLHAVAALDASELRTSDPLTLALWPEWPLIWDGETRVTGDATGTGWLDLTHYCGV